MKETPKQKAIREAWGEYWDSVKDHVDENGNVPCPKFDPEDWYGKLELYIEPEYGYNMEQVGYSAFRPYSIANIDDNNGWIRIDERLPKCFDVVVVLVGNTVYNARFYSGNKKFEDIISESVIKGVTHWRPKEVYPQPIY